MCAREGFGSWRPAVTVVSLSFASAAACATAVDVEGRDSTGVEGAGGAGGENAGGTGTGGDVDGGSLADAAADALAPDAAVECSGPAACAVLSNACNVGVCVNGLCVKSPANESGACEDGLFCTQNDACKGGVCVGGTPVPCSSPDPCHIGVCDEAAKGCTTVPGNDGAPCEDDDPCTLSGVCQQGSCASGAPIDCSAFDGACTKGVCDPASGCKAVPANEGGPCEDGLFCTIEDTCTNGTCSGKPNTCVPPGDVCLVGTCDEAKKACVAVPGNDGAACESGKACIANETCSGGTCGGGKPADDGQPCDDDDACTLGTTCGGGTCGNPATTITQCKDGDGCCPPACAMMDDDCTPLSKPSYDASMTFQDALAETSMTLAWDGTSFWSCSGGSPGGDRLAQYTAAGALVKKYQPNLDFRSVFTVGGGAMPVYARAYSSNQVLKQTLPGVFVLHATLQGGTLNEQSAVVWNPAGTELVAFHAGVISRWTAAGTAIGTITLKGWGSQNDEDQYPQDRGIVVAGKYYLTYANGVLSAWDGSGTRVSDTVLSGAGKGFDSHFSLSYAKGMVWVVDQPGGTWRGYDVGL